MPDMLDYVHTVADKLQQGGVRAGDRVACLGHSNAGSVLLALGCWQVGATVVPLSTRYPAARFQAALSTMQCKFAIVSNVHRKLTSGVQVLAQECMPCPATDLLGGIHLEQLALDPDQEASIILTSGSSGRAKGVLHTIGNHLYSARGSDAVIPFGASDIWLMSLPLYHISGFSLIMRALLHGGSLRFMESGRAWVPCLSDAVTHISLVPTQLQRLLSDEAMRETLPGIKAILVGGAACPPVWVKAARDRAWPIYLTYGSTEAASQVATARADALDPCPGASGKVLPYREVRIASDGEILLRGKTLLKAYVGAQGSEDPLDTEGWFHSGDIGRLDEAERLFVSGRKDLMFVSGGENIFPEEIERALAEVPGFKCCAVVSVPHAEYGRRPVAFVNASIPQHQWPAYIERALSHLERFKHPDFVYAWPAHLPVSLKPDRVALEKHALDLIGD